MGDARRVRWRWVIVLAGCMISQAAVGIVLHPGGPEAMTLTQTPPDELIGRWANNASCVAISPNCVITSRHQGGGIGTIVRIGGRSFKVEAIWNHPARVNPEDSSYQQVDLRIAKLTGANLRHYVKLYRGTREVYLGKCMVVGGYGLGRGKDLKHDGMIYGYAWEDSSAGNVNLRWCTNTIDAVCNDVQTSNQIGLLNHDFVFADFDDPGTTPAEGLVAGFDSGGGWFVWDGEWRLVGITWGADRAQQQEALFRYYLNPLLASPDRMYALRVSSYARWIDEVLASVCTPPEGDLNGDCVVDLHDIALLANHWLRNDCSALNGWCAGADIDGDGRVNAADLGRLTSQYSQDAD